MLLLTGGFVGTEETWEALELQWRTLVLPLVAEQGRGSPCSPLPETFPSRLVVSWASEVKTEHPSRPRKNSAAWGCNRPSSPWNDLRTVEGGKNDCHPPKQRAFRAAGRRPPSSLLPTRTNWKDLQLAASWINVAETPDQMTPSSVHWCFWGDAVF